VVSQNMCLRLTRVATASVVMGLWIVSSVEAQTWRDLRVVLESRCSQYQVSDYSYPQSVELPILENLGSVWSPYAGQAFTDRRDIDIEYIVLGSEAEDSRLCEINLNTQRRSLFSTELLDLTLPSQSVNRQQKLDIDYDAVDWLPTLNQCRLSNREVRIRPLHQLSGLALRRCGWNRMSVIHIDRSN